MPEIVLTNITKSWPRAGGKKGERTVGVDNLNLTIKDRGFITLLGPSGCGKTTTLRMIAGLETPTSGKITIGGKVVFDSEKGINISPDKRNVGFLFQNYALWPHMTVYKNIAFGLENMKWKKEDIKARVTELLAMLKIDELGDRYPSELSGGQQQRVAIARTLAPKPSVLFMDEPLSNLDAKLRLEMRTELKRLHRDTESTFVYVTHDQLEAMTLATEVCLMEKGVLQQYDPPLEVYAKPNNIFVADFVGNPTMNFLRGQVISREGNKAQIRFGETLWNSKRTTTSILARSMNKSFSASVRSSSSVAPAKEERPKSSPPFLPAWKRPSRSRSMKRSSLRSSSALLTTRWAKRSRSISPVITSSSSMASRRIAFATANWPS